MRNIELVRPKITNNTKEDIMRFWERNVNAEEILGKKISLHKRGGVDYYSELEEQRYRSHAHILPWIQQMESGRSVLEIGCGIGMDLFQMAKRGLVVTGIDLTEIAIETAKERFARDGMTALFEVGDATNLKYKDESFDYVYSFGVLHHTQDTEKSIQEAYRVLKNGGAARIMLYNRHSVNEVVHRITGIPFEDKNELCPVVRRFTLNEVRKMFGKFDTVAIRKEYLFGEGYGVIYRIIPDFLFKYLSNHFGWHLMITATKSS